MIFLKKKKEEKKAKKEIREPKKREVKEKIEAQKTPRPKKIQLDSVGKILISPHISEKGTIIAKQNQYIFKVFPKANKIEIKKVIESLYKVNVLSVNTIKIPKKRRKFGKTSGFKKGYKKAIIRIKEGQKIEVFPK